MRINKLLAPFIGDKAFYKMLMGISLPIMLQNGLTNLVSLLDNMMVGAVGTEQMSGVSIVNQLLFVFNLCIFGGLGGAGIFTAQFYGKKDHEGVRHTFRFKLLLAMILFAIGLGVLLLFGDSLINLYLHDGSNSGDIAATAAYGRDYLLVMLWGLLPFALKECYAGTLRESGETVLPMKAGITAILVNLVLNWVFIFGNLGAPAMGVAGAALATVISRVVECLIVMLWTHRHTERAPFIIGAYKSLYIPASLTKQIFLRGMPLLANEFLWSAGVATLNQCYSVRGLAVVAAQNISSTIANLFCVIWMSFGTSVSIIVGQQLGANEFDRAKSSVKRIMAFSIAVSLLGTLLLLVAAPLFPMLYNTTEEVRTIATGMLVIVAFYAPMQAFLHTTYFTLRSGGKTVITFIFDSVYLWVISVPLARLLTDGTALPILIIYAACQYIDILKCALGFWMVKRGMWIHNIVDQK